MEECIPRIEVYGRMTKLLKDHYDRKYSYESDAQLSEEIASVEVPLSRFEAAVKFMLMYFNGGTILELGAGNGSVAKALLASDLDIDQYTVSEISRPRLEHLRRNLRDSRVKVAEIDADRINPQRFGEFDAVLMIALIEHLLDPVHAMQQIRQLVNPGGFVYIDTPNIAKYTRRLKLVLGRFPSTASTNEGLTTYDGQPSDLYDEGHLHYFTYRSLSLLLLQKCGFSKVVQLAYPGPFVPLGRKVHKYLAKLRPQLFSELVLLAHS